MPGKKLYASATHPSEQVHTAVFRLGLTVCGMVKLLRVQFVGVHVMLFKWFWSSLYINLASRYVQGSHSLQSQKSFGV